MLPQGYNYARDPSLLLSPACTTMIRNRLNKACFYSYVTLALKLMQFFGRPVGLFAKTQRVGLPPLPPLVAAEQQTEHVLQQAVQNLPSAASADESLYRGFVELFRGTVYLHALWVDQHYPSPVGGDSQTQRTLRIRRARSSFQKVISDFPFCPLLILLSNAALALLEMKVPREPSLFSILLQLPNFPAAPQTNIIPFPQPQASRPWGAPPPSELSAVPSRLLNILSLLSSSSSVASQPKLPTPSSLAYDISSSFYKFLTTAPTPGATLFPPETWIAVPPTPAVLQALIAHQSLATPSCQFLCNYLLLPIMQAFLRSTLKAFEKVTNAKKEKADYVEKCKQWYKRSLAISCVDTDSASPAVKVLISILEEMKSTPFPK
eukprot:NODE_611_length_1917_cov_5.229122_g433_i1.p1 GENE.NODE_611_length_1917_cov_5.229122_g433_i1~~NODE_611_length_1917_cov_5.229122_g433_i1.p1  ORF type:complete len:378 (-),score=63.47 NODE_611_length_1917_cov_5.229122_g433_i1:93-1226(-)